MRQLRLILGMVWVCCSCLFPGGGMAQVPLGFFHYTTDDGLPHNVGYGICEDATGFVYIGTDNGMVRFDGVDFMPVAKGEDAHSPYAITATFMPEQGVYVGLHEGQLARIEDGRLKAMPGLSNLVLFDARPSWLATGRILLWDEHLNQPDNIFAIARHDSLAKRWQTKYWYYPDPGYPVSRLLPQVAVEDGVPVWEGEKNKFLRISRQFLRWTETPDGRIWLGTKYGLYLFDPQTYEAQLLPATRGKAIYTVCLSPQGGLLLGGENQLLYLTDAGELKQRWQGRGMNGLWQVHADSQGWIYFWGNKRDELYALAPGDSTALSLSMWLELGSLISYSYLDSRGQLWITTNGGGVYCIFGSLFESWPESRQGLNRFIVACQETEDSTFWIARQKDLLGYDQQARLVHYFTLSDPLQPDGQAFIKYICAVEGGLLIGSSAGLYRWSPQGLSKQQHNLPFPVHRSEHDPPYFQNWEDGKLYLFGGKGGWIEAAINQQLSEQLPDKLCALTEAGGTYWMGNQEGLWASRIGAQPVRVEQGSGPFPEQVNGLCVLRDTLWLGTESGLWVMSLGEEWSPPVPWPTPEPKGVPPRVRQLLCDREGRIWMATPTGLLCYNQGKVFSYTRSDGLICNDINHLYIDPRHDLHISTSAGLSRLSLDQDFSQPAPPKLVWHWLRSGDQGWEPTAEPLLNDEDALVVRFGAIDFRDPESIQWEYRLRTDQPWQPLFSRELTLTNLREGLYQLQIRGRQRNSNWSPPLDFRFAVALPWYRSATIKGASVSFLIGLLVLLFFYLKAQRDRQNTRRLELQRRMADLELQGLQAQMNPHFIFNALNAIQHFVISQDVLSANDQLSRFARLIRRFLDASRKRVHSLEAELELLQEYLEMESLCYEGRFSFELRTSGDLDPSALFIPAMLIQPLAENAIRHGLLPKEGAGHLLIYLRPLGERVVCMIEDNGIGRAASQRLQQSPRHQSQGLALLHDRIDTFNRAGMGQLQLRFVDLFYLDRRPRGTRVLLYF